MPKNVSSNTWIHYLLMEIELSFEVETRVSSYSSDLFQIFDRSHQILIFMWIFWILTRFVAHEVIFFNAAQVSFVASRTFVLSKIYDEFITSSVELAKKEIVRDLLMPLLGKVHRNFEILTIEWFLTDQWEPIQKDSWLYRIR